MLFRWQGNGAGTKSAWNDGRNWINESDAPYAQTRYPGSVASAYDEVLFDTALASTALAPAGYDGSALEMIKSFKVGQGYNGAIGSSGAHLKLKILDLVFNAGLAGSIYLDIVDCAPTYQQVLCLDGTAINLKGHIYNLTALKGVGTIETGATLSTALFAFMQSRATDVNFTIQSGVTITGAEQVGGVVTCHSACPSILQYDGVWVQDANITAYRGIGGLCYWDNGNIESADVLAATLDASRGSAPRYIDTARVAPQGAINLDNGLGNIRILNLINTDGGSVVPATGGQLWYKGAYSIEAGLDFHVGHAGSNEVGSTAWMNLSSYDHVTAYCLASGSVTFAAFAASDATGTGAASVAMSDALEIDYGTDPAYVTEMGVWGFRMPAGKPFLQVRAMHGGGTDSTAVILVLRRSF